MTRVHLIVLSLKSGWPRRCWGPANPVELQRSSSSMFSQCLASKAGVPAKMIVLVLSIPMYEIGSPAHADTRERGYQLFPERNLNRPLRRAPACQSIPSKHRIACFGTARTTIGGTIQIQRFVSYRQCDECPSCGVRLNLRALAVFHGAGRPLPRRQRPIGITLIKTGCRRDPPG